MKTKIVTIALIIGACIAMKAQDETVNGKLTVRGNIETLKYDSDVSYPSLTSRGDILHFYRNVNTSLEIGLGGRSNTRRSWILSRHYGLNGVYGKYYSTLHLQPDVGDKSQYRGVAIGYGADVHVGIGTHLAVNGNVGIGTSAPADKLVIKNGVNGISFQATDNWTGFGFNRSVQTGTIYNSAKTAWQLTARDERFSLEGYNGAANSPLNVLKNGNVGIGTITPTQKLDVNGHVKVGNGDWGAFIIDGKDKNDWLFNAHNGGRYLFIRTQDDSQDTFSNHLLSLDRLKKSIGIGTASTGNHKLAVEGSIGAREIKVEAIGWSDFVFEKNYNLPTLKEVENHIKEKGHLENIPSADDVLKNGFYLGEMDSKLLQKIEELTLYTIQQEKEIEQLKKENKKLNSLSERLAKLEKLLEKE